MPRLEFSALIVFDTCCRYTGLVGSGAVSLPGTGKGPFGGGSVVPGRNSEISAQESSQVRRRRRQRRVDDGNRIVPQLLLIIHEEP